MNDLRPGNWTDYQRVLGAKETSHGTLSVALRFPTLRYLNEFVALRCSGDLLELGVFPNAKEITESMGICRAAWKAMPDARRDDPNIMAVVVGDGTSPRTGALLAFRTAWRIISIDPRLKQKDDWLQIRRLFLKTGRVEEYTGLFRADRVIVFMPHSHVSARRALDCVKDCRRDLVVLPCCEYTSVDVGREPDVQYDDWGIHSPDRRIMVWRDV